MWVTFGLLSAFFESLKDLAAKRALRALDVYAVGLANPLFALPVLFVYCWGVAVPSIALSSIALLVVTSAIHVLALSLYFEAIRVSPLSVTLPMIAFTPLFMMLTSPLITGEVGSVWGGLGVVLIVLGTYMLNLKARSDGWFGPFEALLRERGARLMLGVAALWSISGNLDRIGLRTVPKEIWVTLLCLLIAIGFLGVLKLKGRLGGIFTKRYLMYGSVVGTCNGLSLIFYFEAISLAMVGYVVAIKRFSIVLGVIFGYLLYREESIRERLAGAIVMLIGVALISIGG